MNLVGYGGGNGLARIGAALEYAQIPNLQTTLITVSFDDAPHASTGRLREKADRLGYYGDVSRIYCELNKACWRHRDWIAEKITTRLPNGIPTGKMFADLLAEGFFGKDFVATAMQGPYREAAIKSIYDQLGLNGIKDLKTAEILGKKLFEFPPEADNFLNHSLCNMLLFTLERIVRGENLPLGVALDAARDFCRIPDHYRVRLSTEHSTTLVAKTKSGDPIRGQYKIDFRDHDPNFRVFDEVDKISLDPEVAASDDAEQASRNADAVILSCGSINSNIKGLFCAEGIKEALRDRTRELEEAAGAILPVIYVANLMNEPGNTRSGKPYTAADLVDLVQSATGCRLTAVIYDTTPLSKDDEKKLRPNEKVKPGRLRKPFLWGREVSMMVRDDKPDAKIPLQYLHDPEKLGKVFREILLGVPAGVRS